MVYLIIILLCLLFGILFLGLSIWLLLGKHLLFKARLRMVFSSLFILAFLLPQLYQMIGSFEFDLAELIILLFLLILAGYVVELVLPRDYWILPHFQKGGPHLIGANVTKDTMRDAIKDVLEDLDVPYEEDSARIRLPEEDGYVSITNTMIQVAITFRQAASYDPVQEETVIPEFEPRLRERLKKEEPTRVARSIIGYLAFGGFYLAVAYITFIVAFLVVTN